MNEHPKLQTQMRITPFIGPGKIMLLEGVERLGSISAAARALDMSYARAWRLLDALNNKFKTPLVEKASGGSKGGGARLTPNGKAVLGIYKTMEEKARIIFAGDLAVLEELLRPEADLS